MLSDPVIELISNLNLAMVSALSLLMIVLVLRIHPRQRIHRYFIYLNLSLLAYFFALSPLTGWLSLHNLDFFQRVVLPAMALLAYSGVITAGLHWFLVAACYAGEYAWTRGWRRVLLYLPWGMCTVILLLVTPVGAFQSDQTRYTLYAITDWLALLSGLGFVVWSLVLYVKMALDVRHTRYRAQAGLMVFASLIPIVSAFINQIAILQGVFLLQGVLSEWGFSLSSLLLGYSLWRLGFMSLVPVALREVFRHMNDGVLVVGSGLRILQSNRMARRIFPRIEAGIPLAKGVPAIAEMLGLEHSQSNLELAFEIQHEGLIYWVRCVRLKQHGQATGWLVLLSDITVRKHMEDRLAYEALHDPLTGLPNRSLVMDRINQAIKRAQRLSRYDFALLFLDLDDFKSINDRLGHAAGDEVLRVVGKRIKSCLRAADTVARLGGDEFIILLEGVAQHADAFEVAVRIQSTLKQALVFQGNALHPSASIGIAMGSREHRDPQQIIHEADAAMYRAKQLGRGQCQAAEVGGLPLEIPFSAN